jgi:ribosomal protein S18 acetylase RimI-like enzyme
MNMFKFNIRPVVENDVPDILEVYRSCEDFLALGPVPSASLGMVQTDIAVSVQHGSRYCGIMDPTGKMLGVLDYLPDYFEGQAGSAFLELLMIRREYRGAGLGSQVVKWLVTMLVNEYKTKFLWSGVQVNNPNAIRFWNNQGFVIMSEPELFPDQTTAVRLLKTL